MCLCARVRVCVRARARMRVRVCVCRLPFKVVIFNRAQPSEIAPLFFGCGSCRPSLPSQVARCVCVCVTRLRVCARVRMCLPAVFCSKFRYFQPSLFLVLLWLAAAADCKPPAVSDNMCVHACVCVCVRAFARVRACAYVSAGRLLF
jgi:hypothetical protein